MKQLEAIEKILSFLIKDSSVRAVFLKGSIARGDNDEFSDVDLYCLVKEEQIEDFLIKRISYMEQYRPLISCLEANFVGPQIVGVFDNGLHFDLYTVTYTSLPQTDKIKILYDPERLLSNYIQEELSIGEENLIKYFEEISFILLEFEAAYCRNDFMWASHLGHNMIGYLSIILRYIYDRENSQLGLKRLHKKMDKDMNYRLSNAMDLLGPSNVLKGVKSLIEIIKDIISKLPENTSNKINKTFFNYMTEKINRL